MYTVNRKFVKSIFHIEANITVKLTYVHLCFGRKTFNTKLLFYNDACET